MPTTETVKTRHDKAATTSCSVTSVKNTQQSTSLGLMKKATKHRMGISTETVMGMTTNHDGDGNRHDGDSDDHDGGGNNHDGDGHGGDGSHFTPPS
eukprot:9851034-Ditylum_brightwellii.AAC.1